MSSFCDKMKNVRKKKNAPTSHSGVSSHNEAKLDTLHIFHISITHVLFSFDDFHSAQGYSNCFKKSAAMNSFEGLPTDLCPRRMYGRQTMQNGEKTARRRQGYVSVVP